jgi:hypothetical protein
VVSYQVNLEKFTLARWVSSVLALTVTLAMASRSEASILQSNVFSSADETLVLIDQDQGAGSSSSNSEKLRVEGSARQFLEDISGNSPLYAIRPTLPIHEGSTSSSSSSQSSPSTSSGGAMSLLACTPWSISDDTTLTPLAFSQSLVLPLRHGADLLRPPQA